MKNKQERGDSMNKQQGFSLIELLIVVAIIAIIAAIAVPSMLTSRMAANEAGAIQGCRTLGSAEAAFAAVNNQTFTDIATLVTQHFLDERYNNSFSGYTYAEGDVAGTTLDGAVSGGTTFGWLADSASGGRYSYGIAPDQVVRFQGLSTAGRADGAALPKCGTADCNAGDPIGMQASGS
jgi:prepilin-type N-terminal cleavage/methylation domain-containing protein